MLYNMKKVNINKIGKDLIKGNYLYRDNKCYYFSENKCHSLFVESGANDTNEKEYAQLSINFNEWQLELFDVCSKLKKKPSFVFYNGSISQNEILKYLGDDYVNISEDEIEKINSSKPSLCVLNDNAKFEELFDRLVQSRDAFLNNDLCVILNEPEEGFIKNIITYITIARSRNIHFVIHIKDKNLFVEKYSKLDFNLIETHCQCKFISK